MFGHLLKEEVKGLWYGFKEPQIHDTVTKAQKFLGIQDNEMPEIVINDPISYRLGGGAVYVPSEDRVYIITDGNILLKGLVSMISKSLCRLVDLLPEDFGRSTSSLLQDENLLGNITTHELTHSRQFSKVKKLTKDEALRVIKEYVEKLDDTRRKLLKERIGNKDPIEYLKEFTTPLPERREKA